MKVLLVAVGRIRGTLASAVADYQERAARYWRLEVLEVSGGAPGRSPSPSRVRAEEAERIRERLPSDAEVWVLTREGRGLSSVQWASILGERASLGGRDVALVVGGAFGLDEALVRDADRRISLGPVTLPHEMARLVLLEQLYRAGTILRNEPYHKGGGNQG